MKRSKCLSILIFAIIFTFVFSACSSDDSSVNKNESSSSPSMTTDAQTTTSATTSKASTTSAAVTTLPVVMLPIAEDQVINAEPATYESFGIDKADKQAFIEKIKEDTTIPVIAVTTKDNANIVSLETYVSCVVDVFNVAEDMIIDEASAGIRVRGNSSAYYGDVEQILKNQVPYRIKFDSKTNMLGLNDGAECKSWVLLKADWDLVRNDIAYRFGRAIMEGEDNYCSDGQLVHVYVNEEFKGIYLLCEQSQVNKYRVNITEPDDGYTGTDIGYYLEIDNYAASEEGNYYFTMDYEKATVEDIEGEKRQFVSAEYSIKNDVYSQNQIDFIDKYTNNLFEIVYEACENEKYLAFDANYDLVESEFDNAKDTVNAVMDIQSVVDMYILYEITHDYDCGEGSFYMCVDFAEDSECPKMRFTSPWDFNWAYDGAAKNKYWAAAFSEQSFVNQYGDRSNPWFIVLGKQDWFIEAVKEKWTALANDKALRQCISDEIAYLNKYEQDLIKSDDWAVNSAFNLFNWIYDRIDWLDSIWWEK